MRVILLLISITGLSVKLSGVFVFPVSVIRGIQLGLGMMLIKASASLMKDEAIISLLQEQF